MARTTHTKTPKGRNGEGDSLTVYFDPNDPAERKALEAARLLAAKHGRRKQAIIALLEAVYTCYEQTGELMTAGAISTALLNQAAPISYQVATQASERAVISKPRRQGTYRAKASQVEVVPSGGKTSAETVAKNFLQSVSGLAAGFFD